MTQETIHFLGRFDVAPDTLWSIVADHEGMSRWVGAQVSVIADPGDGGVGTVRRIRRGGLRLDEEVTYCDPPRRMVYRLIRGLPLSYHQGELLVEPWDGGSQLSWRITVASPIPGFATSVARVARRGINDALKRLHTQLQA